MDVWLKVALLSIGGACGVNARYWLSLWIGPWASPRFPWATFVVNVSGSILIGAASSLLVHRFGGNEAARLLIVVGFLGGYTTFSSYTLEALGLLEQSRPVLAAIYLGGSVLVGLTAASVGVWLGRELSGRL